MFYDKETIFKLILRTREHLQKIAEGLINLEEMTSQLFELEQLRKNFSEQLSLLHKARKNITWSDKEKKKFFEDTSVCMEHLDKAIKELQQICGYLSETHYAYIEQDAIKRGLYQAQLYEFTYNMLQDLEEDSSHSQKHSAIICRLQCRLYSICDTSHYGSAWLTLYSSYPYNNKMEFY